MSQTTMNRRGALLVLAFSTLVGSLAHAENATLVTLDSTDLELVERRPEKTTITFTIPARLNVDKVTIRRWSISQDGRLIDGKGSRIDFDKAADGTPALSASFDLLRLAAAGHYVATIEFVAPKAPTDAAGPEQMGPPAPPPANPTAVSTVDQTLQLKLNRPAAELRTSTPLRIERTVYVWCLWEVLRPSSIILNEATGKSWVKIDPREWDTMLRHGDDAPEQQFLHFQLPDNVSGWGQAQATARLDGWISLGTTSGTLTIRSPQLAAQTVDFPITVVSRLTALWLLPVIAIGIALGWYVRTRLDARRERLAAIASAEQEIGTLEELINTAVDRSYREKLKKIGDTLVGKIDDETSTPVTIVAETTKAATGREAVVKEMNDLFNALRTKLKSWVRPSSVSEPLPDEATEKLKELRESVERLTKALQEGQLTDVDDAMQNELPEVTRLRSTLADWLHQFDDLKTQPPRPWADTMLAAKLSAVGTERDQLAQELNAANTPEALWKALIDAAVFLGHLKQDLFGTVRDQAVAIAGIASATVREFGPKMEEHAAAIDSATTALPDGALAGRGNAVAELTKRLNTLRDAIVEALNAAWNDATQPLSGVDQGEFSRAFAALESKAAVREKDLSKGDTVPAHATAVDVADVLARLPQRPATRIIPTWQIALNAAAATVSEPVTVQAQVIVPLNSDHPDVTLSWFRNGIPVGRTAPGTLERSFTFSRPGTVQIRIVAVDGAGASDAAELTLQVRAVHGARAVKSKLAEIANVELIQNLSSGAVIIVAGWLIFSPTFTGTFPEFFAAFLWGFSVDVGAAKVRELTESLKALKVPTAIPKQG